MASVPALCPVSYHPMSGSTAFLIGFHPHIVRILYTVEFGPSLWMASESRRDYEVCQCNSQYAISKICT